MRHVPRICPTCLLLRPTLSAIVLDCSWRTSSSSRRLARYSSTVPAASVVFDAAVRGSAGVPGNLRAGILAVLRLFVAYFYPELEDDL